MAFLVGALSAAIVGTVAGVFMLTPPRPPAVVGEPGPRRPQNPAFQDAKNLIREGKWVEAKARLQELKALEPNYPGLVDYLAHVEKEIPNQEHLTAAKEALAAKTLAVAKVQLDQVSADTTMFERVNQLKHELRDSADARVREAQALQDAGHRQQASAILADVVAVFPNERLARASLERAQASSVVDTGSRAWELVVHDFMQGDISSAVALAEACAPQVPRCKSGLKDLEEFRGLREKIDELDFDQLTRTVELDRKITGAPSPCRASEKARVRQANILYKNAAAARARGAWPRAIEFARLTLQADPSHRGATLILQDLRGKARAVFLRGHELVFTDLEEALRLFRQVMDMTPPDDELHRRAEDLIEKLHR